LILKNLAISLVPKIHFDACTVLNITLVKAEGESSKSAEKSGMNFFKISDQHFSSLCPVAYKLFYDVQKFSGIHFRILNI